jgi:hypothetical protein
MREFGYGDQIPQTLRSKFASDLWQRIINHNGNGARSTSLLPLESSGSTTFGFLDQSDGNNDRDECRHKTEIE